MMQLRVEQIQATDTLALRNEILRPGKALAECVFPADDALTTRHFGAKEVSGKVLAIVSIYQKQNHLLDGVKQYQIRGMAVSPSVQRRGVGQLLLNALEAYAQTERCDVIWANARSTAVGFYARAGYQTVSSEFDIAGVGPHFIVAKSLY